MSNTKPRQNAKVAAPQAPATQDASCHAEDHTLPDANHPLMLPKALKHTDFTAHTGKTCQVVGPAATMSFTLEEVTLHKEHKKPVEYALADGSKHPIRAQPFTLLFSGMPGEPLPQGIYRFTIGKMELDLFMCPNGRKHFTENHGHKHHSNDLHPVMYHVTFS